MAQYDGSEIRRDYRTGFFSIIVPGRSQRPHELEEDRGAQDLSKCPFEPQNIEENLKIMHVGEPWEIIAIKNKFPELNGETPLDKKSGFLSSISGYGYNEVVIESPDHNLKLENMDIKHLDKWLGVLIEREEQLYSRNYIKYVQIFRNFGADAGASIGHPHTQIMAWPVIIGNIKRRAKITSSYRLKKGSCIYEDAIKIEEPRRLYENGSFSSFAPFASRMTAESIIIPKRHVSSLIELSQKEREDLLDEFRRIVSINKAIFGGHSYNILFYELKKNEDFHMHFEIYPRLSTLAGVELGQNVFVNTIEPEKYSQDFRARLGSV